jgi:hypothetical protein
MPDGERFLVTEGSSKVIEFKLLLAIENEKRLAGYLFHDKTRHFYCLIELEGPVLVPICRVF